MTVDDSIPDTSRSLVEFLRSDKSRFRMTRCGTTPTSERIHKLFGLFRAVTFPEILMEHNQSNDSEQVLINLVEQFRNELVDLACWTLQQTNTTLLSTNSNNGHREHARSTIDDIFKRLPQIIELLYQDVEAACDGDPACTGPQEVVLCYPGFLAITIHRLAHELYQTDLKLLARVLSEWAHSETGIDLHPGATIGHHFFIDHGTGVVIGETCHVGNHVKVYQGVTLGALSFPKDELGRVIREPKRHPTIEDHVVIYASATILGGRTVIGKHSVIGGSVWITNSIEPNTTVVMEPPRLKIRSKSPETAPIEPGK
ncbi:MAG: serine O-acetyltransferase EpsC [Pirellulaceae bacterium]